MKNAFKKWTGLVFLSLLLALAPVGMAEPLFVPGTITAEAATKKVAMNKKSGSLAVGGKTTIQLKNINTKRAISWTSSNKKVATVKKGSSGKATVTAKKAGKATITAKYAGKKYTFKVTVKSPVLSKKSITLTAGKKATVQLKNIVSSKKITWVSKKKSIATVKKGSNGKATITAKKKGKVYIYAKYNGKNYRVTVNVKAPAPKLSKSSATLSIGGKTTLSLSNAVSGKKTTWKSSKSSVVSIKKNSTNKVTLTAKKAGKATIYATHNGKKYKCTVTVKAPSLNRSSLSLVAGKSGTITVNNRVSGKTVKASTSNSRVATVGVSGSKITVKGIGAGTATIKVAHNGKTFSCKVTVTKPASTPAPSKPSTSTPNTTKPTTPSTGGSTVTKPSTPSTEAPSKPSTPETNPPKPTYTYDLSNFTSKSIEVYDNIVFSIKTEDQGVTFELGTPNVVFINKLYCMEGKAVLGISGGSAGTTSITAYASDNSVIGTINITVSNPILKVAEYYLNLSIAGGEMDSICLSTSLPADKISYVSSSANLEIIGYDKNFKSISFIGRVAGQYQIQISGGGETVVVNITVTSNDTAWMQYDKWISNLLSSLGCSKSDPVESFKKLGAWLVDNRDYD